MANINSITSNSYSSSGSIYGSRNVLTGLASGMDTETMIENAVTGYQTKIQELQQSQTKIEWKQDAYREIIDQMYNITNKYTSYSSATNLSSNTFFTSNVTTTANGDNASAVSATGKATSNIQINAVTQLASAARYAVDANALSFNATRKAEGGAIAWDDSVKKGVLSGTMTLRLGNKSVEIKFTEDDKYETLDQFVAGINSKLEDQDVDVQAKLSGSEISFSVTGDAAEKGDSVYISGASGNLKEQLNVATARSTAAEDRFSYTSFSVANGKTDLTKTMTMPEYLSGKTIDVTLDGMTKSIKIGTLTQGTTDELVSDLQQKINKEFGSGKVTVGLVDKQLGYEMGENGESVATFGKCLKFDVTEGSGSTLKITSSVGKELGIGEAGVSNYFNTSQKLGELLDESTLRGMRVAAQSVGEEVRYFDKDGNELKQEDDGNFYRIDSNGKYILKDNQKVQGIKARTFGTDADGNLVSNYANEEGEHYLVNAKGDYLYNLEINGVTIGDITKDTALESVLNKINSNSEVGVKVGYSNLTSQFVFTANDVGEGGKIEFDNALAKRLFGSGAVNQKSLEEVFGQDFFDENGNATIYYGSANLRLGTFSKNSRLEDLVNALTTRGTKMTVSYDANSNSFSVANGTGTSYFSSSAKPDGRVSYRDVFENGVGSYTAGKDAIVNATVNGKELTLKRSTNVINMDGLSVTLKSEFDAREYEETGEGENLTRTLKTNADGTAKVKSGAAVTFTTSSDSDKIVDAIKSFVEDVNKLMNSVHSAYTTQPITKTSSSSSKGTTYYEPLTEDDKKDMSESAVEKYEEKAKTGLLFGDTDLRTLYDRLLTGIQSYGSDRVDLESIGLTTTYSSGVTTLQLNESKLRSALDSDPDKVRNVFTKMTENGSATNGLMASLKSTLNTYGSTSLASPGLLVSKAGTKLSAVSLLNNNLAKQISNLDSQIESWQTKLSNKIDYYTKQFTQLEKLMSTMNNQSSMLADMMGY